MQTYLSSLLRLFALLGVLGTLNACSDDTPPAQSCETATDCPDGARCVGGTCTTEALACATSTDCNFGDYCVDSTCVDATCSGDSECTDAVCVNNRCREGCSTNDQCSDGQTCNLLTRRCEVAGCTTASCPQFQTCDTDLSPSACQYTGDCNNDAVCQAYAQQLNDGNDYICSTAEQRCVIRPECTSDAECTIGEICEPRELDGRRVCRRGCRTNEECGGSQICSAEAGYRCVDGCETTADCPDPNQACFERQCVDTCQTRSECTGINPGYICTGNPRVCQACTDSSQCPSTQFCDFTQGNSEEEAANPSRGLCINLPPTCPPDPYGSNDNIDSAFAIQTLPFEPADTDRPIFCREKPAGDWFLITAGLGEVIEVRLNYQTAGNLDLALRTINGTELAVSDRPPSEDNGEELIRYGAETGGTFLVQVRGTILNDSVPYDLSISSTTPAACTDDGFEPNNAIAEAVALPQSQEESLQVCGNDADFFQLDVLDNQIVTIRAAAPARLGDIDLVLRNSNGDIVAQALNRTDVEQILYTNDNAQILTLEVRAATNTGNIDYMLEWTQRDNQCSDAFEPNDSCASATLLNSGTFDELAVCSDADYYAVDLLPLQTVTFRAIYDPAVAAGDLDITLFGPNDCATFIATETRTTIPNTTLVAERIQYTAQTGGRFNLLTNLFAGINVPYTLEVDIQDGPPCLDDSLEPNNDGTQATVIPIADARLGTDNVVTGLRLCDADSDWFEIDLQEGDVIRWDVTFNNAQGNIDAFIIAPDQTTVLASGIGDTGTESLSYTVGTGEAGTYYLKVEGKNPVRNDYWLLTYVNGVGPADPACPDPYENNDIAGDSKFVGEGGYGLLICSQDDDWFETDIRAGETITIDLSFTHSLGNIDIILYDDRNTTSSVAESRTATNNESVTYYSARDQTLKWRIFGVGTNIRSPYTMDVSIQSAVPCQDDIYAPNRDSSEAALVTAPGLYAPVVKCEDEEDWYKVELGTQLSEVFIAFNDRMANLDLTVYDSTMTVVGQGNSTTNDESVVFTPTAAGMYFIKVASPERARLPYYLMLYTDTNNDGTVEGPEDRLCPDEYENNDSLTSAKPLPLGTTDNLLVCWEGPANQDNDYYSVFVPAGATLTVDVLFSHADGDLNARLYRSTNTTPVASSLTTTDNETLTVTNSSTGENYTIYVFGAGVARFTTRYTLDVELSFTDTCVDDLQGAVDLASATTPIATGALNNLNLCEGTEDWFRLPAGTTSVEVNMELNNLLGNIDIELTNAAGETIVASTASTNVENLIATGLDGAQTYYLRAFAQNSAFFRNEYDLWVSINGAAPAIPFCPDSYERNDSITTAVSFSSALYQWIDMTACGPDVDWYGINVTSAATDYVVQTFFDHVNAEADLTLEVYNPSGVLVTNGTSATTTNDEFVRFRPTVTGTHYIKVSNVSSSTSEVPYFLYTDRFVSAATPPTCREDSYEPNDVVGDVRNAPTLGNAPGSYALGSCGASAVAPEVDHYSFVMPASGTATVTVMYDSTAATLSGTIYYSVDIGNGNRINTDKPFTASTNRLTTTVTGTPGERIGLRIFNATVSAQYFLTIKDN